MSQALTACAPAGQFSSSAPLGVMKEPLGEVVMALIHTVLTLTAAWFLSPTVCTRKFYLKAPIHKK